MGKYLDLIRQHERAQPIECVKTEAALRQQRAIDPISTLHPGDWIEWHRAGAVQHGTVDFVHVDADGRAWAFVTLGESWAAVNLKFATVSTDVT
jgi:hypothetical protein